MRLVVVSDSHGAPHPRAAALIAAARPDHILHAGDVGDLQVLAALEEIAPVTAVRGNIDALAPGLPDIATIELRDGDAVLYRLLLVHSAVYGPKLRGDVARLAHAEGSGAVVCGHSHVPFLGRDQGLVIMNPGSIGPRRFHLPIVFGILEVSRERLTFEHVSCETGARWTP
jgi:putative phosphoesterase